MTNIFGAILALSITSTALSTALASTNSGQPLYRDCSTTSADTNPNHSSSSMKLYSTNAPVDVPPPGAPPAVSDPKQDRKATLVLLGVLYPGMTNLDHTQFTSDDGQVTADFQPDLKGATFKRGDNYTVTYSNCATPGLAD